MPQKSLLLALGVVLVGIVFAGCVPGFPGYQKSSDDAMMEEKQAGDAMEKDGDAMEKTGDAMEGDAMEKEYTLAEVAAHASASDCWLAIEGKVYDVTDFIASGNHPGGEAIINGCGKDATAMFNDRPNGSGPHSEQARSFLPNFYIGNVAE